MDLRLLPNESQFEVPRGDRFAKCLYFRTDGAHVSMGVGASSSQTIEAVIIEGI
jgi:hypothetical protein